LINHIFYYKQNYRL